MDDDNDHLVAGADGARDGAADPLSPPERDTRLRRNPAMVGVVIVVALAATIFVVVLAIG